MPNYEKLYHKLFNDITDVVKKLQQSQIDAEEIYLDMCEAEEKKDTPSKVIKLSDKKK